MVVVVVVVVVVLVAVVVVVLVVWTLVIPCSSLALPRIDEVSWLDFSQCRGPVTPRVTSYGPESAYKSTTTSFSTKTSSNNCGLL